MRKFVLQIVDEELNTVVFDHPFIYDGKGKLKFLPTGNDIKVAIKRHAEKISLEITNPRNYSYPEGTK